MEKKEILTEALQAMKLSVKESEAIKGGDQCAECIITSCTKCITNCIACITTQCLSCTQSDGMRSHRPSND